MGMLVVRQADEAEKQRRLEDACEIAKAQAEALAPAFKDAVRQAVLDALPPPPAPVVIASWWKREGVVAAVVAAVLTAALTPLGALVVDWLTGR